MNPEIPAAADLQNRLLRISGLLYELVERGGGRDIAPLRRCSAYIFDDADAEIRIAISDGNTGQSLASPISPTRALAMAAALVAAAARRLS